MRVGYIIASHDVTKNGKRIGYCYREEPDREDDSGWRVFSGDETQEYADDPGNFSMYNASTIVEIEPRLADLLQTDFPAAFERDERTGGFKRVEGG